MSNQNSPIQLTADLIKKLDVPGPRYTSYPTAPEWTSEFTANDYISALNAFDVGRRSLSLYVHIPFCAKMCYYCGCNVVIRKSNVNVGDAYIDDLVREFSLVARQLSGKPVVRQLHWGGGTPNFLSVAQINRLMAEIQRFFTIDFSGEVAVEVDPRTVNADQIETFRNLGFNRVSMGIQDFNPEVQSAISRIQPFEAVRALFKQLRDLRFESVNVDLIYGLPLQTVRGFLSTVDQILALNPDRIALYSYAHVPWLKSHQKLISIDSLPDQNEKLDIFLNAREAFIKNGYSAIAMDHFAKPSDELAVAYNAGVLYRNFMGYTVKPADDYLGFGVSSIGNVSNRFVQNVKELDRYSALLSEGHLPVDRGLALDQDDQIRQWVILSLMCRFSVDKAEFENRFSTSFDLYFDRVRPHLTDCEQNGLVRNSVAEIAVTELGKLFVRNVCMGFDRYLKPLAERRFSRTI